MFGQKTPPTPPAAESMWGFPMPDGLDQHLLGVAVLLVLLILVASRLHEIHALLVPGQDRPSLPQKLWRKVCVASYGAVFLVLSKDKVSKKQLKKAHAEQAIGGGVEKEIRLIFVRHGESVWNYVFNRGFGPSFLVRLAKVTLQELCLLPWDDSAYIDSPLSGLGLEQCSSLQSFLRKPCLDKAAEADFAALTSGEGHTLLVTSPLRRAAATLAIALSDRLRRSKETVCLHSGCQEISRNFDTMALSASGEGVRSLWLPDPNLELRYDAAPNTGNKALSCPGLVRLNDFAAWAADRPEGTIVIAGHSLWFRSFFQLFLPAASTHPSKSRKIVNCGVVGLTLQALRDYHGTVHYRVDEDSIRVIYGGFASK